jgi:hypothetical protein
MLNAKQKLLINARKKFVLDIRSIAIMGVNNINSELLKQNQQANTSYTVKGNKISFVIEPKIDSIETKKISIEQRKKVFKGFENIPLELLSQEMVSDFSVTAIDKALERTQVQAEKRIQNAISKLI